MPLSFMLLGWEYNPFKCFLSVFAVLNTTRVTAFDSIFAKLSTRFQAAKLLKFYKKLLTRWEDSELYYY